MEGYTQKSENLLHGFDTKNTVSSGVIILVVLVVILLGVGGGFFLAKGKSPLVSSTQGTTSSGSSQIAKGTMYGSNDTSTFKDSATGVVKAGGINGEGQYHLVRPGGDSQNVYMTSSLVDLSQFVNHKVQVWGQTQAAKSAGWLMDVGRVEVIE